MIVWIREPSAGSNGCVESTKIVSRASAGTLLAAMSGVAFGICFLLAIAAIAESDDNRSSIFCAKGVLWQPAEIGVLARAREYDFGERFTVWNQKLFGSKRLESIEFVDAYAVADKKTELPETDNQWIAIEEPQQATPWWKVPVYSARVVTMNGREPECEDNPNVKFLAPIPRRSADSTAILDSVEPNETTRFVVESAKLAEHLRSDDGS